VVALTRLFDHYVYTAAAAMDSLYPHERQPRIHLRRSTVPPPPLETPQCALSWLDDKRHDLARARVHMAIGWPRHGNDLSTILDRYLNPTPTAIQCGTA